MLVFRPSFVNYCPPTFSLVHLPPPSPSQSPSTVYTESVWLGGGGVIEYGLTWIPYSAEVQHFISDHI
jgi:hypothetical protein